MNLFRRFLIISLVITLIISLPTLKMDIYAQEEPLTLLSFKGMYSVGMIVNLDGNVNASFTEGDDVSIKVTNPNVQIYENNIVKLDEGGLYAFTFKLEGAQASVLGVHMVEAIYKNFKVNTIFEVKGKPTLTISVDKSTYNIGDIVTITGKVTPRLQEQIEIKIYGFNNIIWKFVPVSAQRITFDGIFTVEAGELMGKNIKGGKYMIEASYADGLAKSSLEFNVQISNQVAIGNLMLINQLGKALDEIFIGQQVLIQAEVKNNLDEKQQFAFLVLIKDTDGITDSLSWITGSLPISETLNVAQSWIPEKVGNFTAEVFLWESISNPTPLSNKVPKIILLVKV